MGKEWDAAIVSTLDPIFTVYKLTKMPFMYVFKIFKGKKGSHSCTAV